MDDTKFKIEVDGEVKEAEMLKTVSLDGNNYAIYAIDKGDFVEELFLVGEPPHHRKGHPTIEHYQQKSGHRSEKEVVALHPGQFQLHPGHNQRRATEYRQRHAAAQQVDKIGSLTLHQGEGIFGISDIFQAAHHVAAETVHDITIEAYQHHHYHRGLPGFTRCFDPMKRVRGEGFGQGRGGAPHLGGRGSGLQQPGRVGMKRGIRRRQPRKKRLLECLAHGSGTCQQFIGCQRAFHAAGNRKVAGVFLVLRGMRLKRGDQRGVPSSLFHIVFFGRRKGTTFRPNRCEKSVHISICRSVTD